jgi:site-specific DNA-methyltransferase (adenine-specific)
MLAAKAKANMSAGGGDKVSANAKTGSGIVPNPVDTRKEIATIAGVSDRTLDKAEFLSNHADESTKQKLRKGDTTINAEYKRLKTEQNRKEREEQKQANVHIPNDDRIDLHVASVADAVRYVAAESVDYIVCDPPYPREYLGVYEDLAAFALHSLKSGGSLLCMVGQSYLPEIIATLAAKLKYHWTLAYLTPGGQATQLWERKINTFWKPILWFTKGDYTGGWIGDVANSKGNDKNHHHWGQSESGMYDLMERFLYPNMTVCDPFLGGGTTGVCVLRLGCKFIGLDIDPNCIDKSQLRLAEVLQEKED